MTACNECGQAEWSLPTTSDPQVACAVCGAVQKSEGVQMSVRHQQTVERYTQGRFKALAMLENLREFIESMPVADAHGAIPGVDYAYVNRFETIREKLSDCSLLTDAMSEG
jgi:hypothetical protein